MSRALAPRAGADDALAVFFGTGLGAAALTGGNLLLGARAVALELGHVVVHDGDAPCGCGGRGCVETEIGGRYLLARARDIDPSTSDLSPLAGDLERIAELGARALTAAVTTLNPEVLVLGGGVLDGLEGLFEALGERTLAMLSPPTRVGLRIARAELGDAAGIVGAASQRA